MKNSEKKGLIILIIVALVIIFGIKAVVKKKDNAEQVATGQTEGTSLQTNNEEYVTELNDGSKLNVSEELNKAKTLDGLEITNIQLREIRGTTTLLADVQNKTGSQTIEKPVTVEILDKNGNIITKLKGIIDSIPAGEKVQLNIAVSGDVSNAYDFIISNR